VGWEGFRGECAAAAGLSTAAAHRGIFPTGRGPDCARFQGWAITATFVTLTAELLL